MEYNWDWFSWSWFSIENLNNFHWENPFFLILIPAVPVLFIVRWLLYFPIREKLDVALTSRDLKKWNLIQILRLTPTTVQILFIFMVLLALARPQMVNERIDQFSEGINILLVMDVSESMQLEDLKPNRLEASKEVALKFVNGRNGDRIGIVVFAGDAYSLSPLTNDHDLLNSYIRDIDFSLIENSGTAIGSAIGVSINRLNQYKEGSKIMILISDGENTAGSLDPIVASKLAYGYGIKIYTIGIGNEGVATFGRDSTGKVLTVASHLDETMLRKIAEQTNGKFFRATNNSSLLEIFTLINTMEKSKIRETRFRDTQDYYTIYLIWALVLLLLWMALKNSFLNNFLED